MRNKKVNTSFRLSEKAIAQLKELKLQVNKNTSLSLSYTDIIELLLRRAKPDQLVKKINDL